MSARVLTLTILLAAATSSAQAVAPHHGGHPLVHFFFHLGLVGLFLVSIVDSSFVPLPIPGVTDIMLILYAANHENIFLLVGIATLGSAIGGLFSHAAGQAGGMKFLEKHVPAKLLKRTTAWMERHAILAVSLPAILPPPMPLSPFVLVAGAVHMSRGKFMTAFTISRFLRHAIAVWLGLRYGHAVLGLWARFSAKWAMPVLIVLWTVILTFTGIAIWKIYKTSREMNLKPSLARGRSRSTATP
jgi:membrane protein YqaA with SNARE-associated domain